MLFSKEKIIAGRGVAAQVVREFWPGISVATLWTTYSVWQGDASLTAIDHISRFFTCLFFVSWFTGNVNRIKKNIKTEKGIGDIHEKTQQLITELEAKTVDIIGHMTGGDSFCWVLFIHPLGATNTEPVLIHEGAYSMHDVKVRIMDMFELEKIANAPLVPREYLSIGQHQSYEFLKAGNAQMMHRFAMPQPVNNRIRLRIEFTSPGRSYSQIFLIDTRDEVWAYATKVITFEQDVEIILKEHISASYPINEDGSIDWTGLK